MSRTAMSGMSGASMLRTRRKDVNVKPNRKLDRKSSRGMLYENEELRLRTININAEVERGQSDIKKLKRENDQLKREISALRYEYDRLDQMLRDRKSSPEQSDDSASGCTICAECVDSSPARAHVAFNDLSVVPEEDAVDSRKSPTEQPCSCEECTNPQPSTSQFFSSAHLKPTQALDRQERTVDVIVHDAPPETSRFFESVTTPAYHVAGPPPPGFVIAPYQPPKFHTGGNVEDLLGEVQISPTMQSTFIQQNSIFMCNTKRITHQKQQCCCRNRDEKPNDVENQPKSYVTEKNIELTYDYPRAIPNTSPEESQTTTTEVASTVVFVERRIPIRPKKFEFFFRSRSAPVGESEEPIYATVNKLPKKLRRMELANLEREVAYRAGDPDSSTRTEITLKTDSEHSPAHQIDDDTSHSEKEKSTPIQRPDTPKAKKRKRFSFTFKKRERKRREKKKEIINGNAKNGTAVPLENENERLLEKTDAHEINKNRHCNRHRPRNTMSSCSSGPRFKRDSYQEMTTSHSEHERTNSISSSVNSIGSACTHKSRKFSASPPDGSIPWCGCWGAGCI